jgi:hypothetical protein
MRTLYDAVNPWRRSVMDRFATVAAACRMAIDAGVLPWKIEDTDVGIERCVERWADGTDPYETDTDDDVDAVVPVSTSNAVSNAGTDHIAAAIVAFMGERQSWEGTATELSAALGGVKKSAKSLGRWLIKTYAQRELRKAGFEIVKTRENDVDRGKRIRIETIKAE